VQSAGISSLKRGHSMITALQLDAFKEIVNIGVGRAAASLNDMLDSPIVLEVPEVRMITYEDFKQVAGAPSENFSCVQLGFKGSFSGMAALVFPPASAVKLVAAMTAEEPENPGLDGVMAGTLNEVGNIVINCVIGTIGNILEKTFDFSLPNYLHGALREILQVGSHSGLHPILLVKTHFIVQEKHIDGNIFIIFEASSFDALLTAIDHLYE
jgi:chemotaxis protein CheC